MKNSMLFPDKFVMYGVTIESPIESPMVSPTILHQVVLVSMSFSRNNKNVSLNTDCDRLSATYSYASHGMRRLVSFMFCVFYASYRVRMVVQSFWITRSILPSP